MSAVVKKSGCDIDGTAAEYVDGALRFNPLLLSHFLSGHIDLFVTARHMRTSALSVFDAFLDGNDIRSTTMMASLEAISKDIEKVLLDLDAETRPKMPAFTSVFDQEGGVNFLYEVLLPFEQMLLDLVDCAKAADGSKDDNSIALLARILGALDKLEGEDNLLARDEIYGLLVKHVFSSDLGDKPLSKRLSEFDGSLSDDQYGLIDPSQFASMKFSLKDASRLLERFYLRHHHAAYYQEYCDEIYPRFKAHGKTPRLAMACRETSKAATRYDLLLIDDSASFIASSEEGVAAMNRKGEIEVSLQTVTWGRDAAKNEAALQALITKPENLKSEQSAAVSPRTSTACLNVLYAPVTAPSVELTVFA